MKLFLVQHGDALAKDVDSDRALSDQGEKYVARMAVFLKGKVNPNKIIHSGKTRARQSAEILAQTLAANITPEAVSGADPNDPVAPFAKKLEESDGNLLFVGHLPFLSKLVSQLTTAHSGAFTDFHPGGMVCLSLNEGKTEDISWQIQWMLQPELLPRPESTKSVFIPKFALKVLASG